jgi:hypothetical protein
MSSAGPYRLRGSTETPGASAEHLLGARVRTFYGAAHHKAIWFAAPFVLLLAYITWLAHQDKLEHWFNSTFSVVAVSTVFVLAIALITHTAAVGGGEMIRLHAAGILDMRLGPRALRFDEILSITAVASPDRTHIDHYLLGTSDGATLTFGRAISAFEELADELRARIAELRMPELRRRVAGGGTARFGAFRADGAGILVGPRTLPWGEVSRIETARGEVVVRGADGERLEAAPVEAVPNAFLLAELVQDLRTRPPPNEAPTA